MSPIFITEDDVGQLLSMKEAVKAVEQEVHIILWPHLGLKKMW